MSRRLRAILSAVALAACSDAIAPPPEPTATRPVKSAAEPPREVPSVFDEDAPAAPASGSGPAPVIAPRDASPEAQRAAALVALRGDADPKQVEVEATEGGLPLEPSMRDELAPGVTRSMSPARRSPGVRMGPTQVNGRLPPEVIQRIVRQHFGRFRLCYETALREDARLAGSVIVAFAIATDGSVKNVVERGSTIKHATMRACVAKAFTSLSFPQPEGGVVNVTYPLHFTPPDK